MKWKHAAAAAVVAPVVVLGAAQVRSAALIGVEKESARLAVLEARSSPLLDEMTRGDRSLPGDVALAQAPAPLQPPSPQPDERPQDLPPVRPDEAQPALPPTEPSPDAPPIPPAEARPDLPVDEPTPEVPPIQPELQPPPLPMPTVEVRPDPFSLPTVAEPAPSRSVDGSLSSSARRPSDPVQPFRRIESRRSSEPAPNLMRRPTSDPMPADVAIPSLGYDPGSAPAADDEERIARQAGELARRLAESEGMGPDTSSDPAMEKAREDLRDLVNQQFDIRQKRYAADVDALEARVAKLREMIRKRQDSRTWIIGQRMQQLEIEAQGMGW